MRLEMLPKMHLAFLYDVGEQAQKQAYERLDRFLEEKGLNPSQIKHYFYYLKFQRKEQTKMVFILYALVNDALNASGGISTMSMHPGPYLVFELDGEAMRKFAMGDESIFENQVKQGLSMYKKTRMMEQVFALIEESVENHQVVYRCHVPVK